MRRVRSGSDAVMAVAVVLVTVFALLDLAFHERAVLIGLLVVGPLVAATGTSARRTFAVAVYALVLAVVLGIPNDIFLTVDHVVRFSVIAVAGGLSVWAANLRTQREEAMRRVAHVAEVAQRAILRPPPPELGSIAFAARYLSASEEALIGGDLYETAYTPHGVRVIVGDVRGKGLDAVGLAAVVLGRFREVVFAAPTLADVATAIDEQIVKSGDAEEFVTAVLVEFPEDGGVRIVNCGHHPPMRIADDTVDFLVSLDKSLPLGLGPDVCVEMYPLGQGERLLLYTDGLVEARNPSGRFFPVGDESEVLRDVNLQSAVDGLLERLVHHVGGRLNDDLAVVLAERRGG